MAVAVGDGVRVGVFVGSGVGLGVAVAVGVAVGVRVAVGGAAAAVAAAGAVVGVAVGTITSLGERSEGGRNGSSSLSGVGSERRSSLEGEPVAPQAMDAAASRAMRPMKTPYFTILPFGSDITAQRAVTGSLSQ